MTRKEKVYLYAMDAMCVFYALVFLSAAYLATRISNFNGVLLFSVLALLCIFALLLGHKKGFR